MRYFGASVDAPETNAAFAESLGMDCPIFSDPTKTVARAHDILGASGLASRSKFCIGADGHILDIDKNVSASSHGNEVVAKLTELGVSRK